MRTRVGARLKVVAIQDPGLPEVQAASSWLALRSVCSCTRVRSATRWAHMEQACRSIRISSRAGARWYFRRTLQWRLGLATGRKGLLPARRRFKAEPDNKVREIGPGDD